MDNFINKILGRKREPHLEPHLLDDEEAFWTSYGDLETERIFKLRKSDKLLIWEELTYQRFEDKDPQFVNFWRYLLDRKQGFTAVLVTINLVFLFSMLACIGMMTDSPLYLALIPEFGMYVFLNLAIVLFLCVRKYAPHLLTETFKNGDVECWWQVCHLILFTVVGVALTDIYIHNLLEEGSESCYASNIILNKTTQPGDAWYFINIEMFVSMIQMEIFALLPIPVVTNVLILVCHGLREILKIQSCENLASSTEYHGQIQRVVAFLQVSYVILGMRLITTNYMFLRSVETTYENIILHKDSNDDKRKAVQLLSSDIKANLQRVSQIMQKIRKFSNKTTKITTSDKNVNKSIDQLNILVDDLLFLAHIEEGRFKFECSQQVNFGEVVDSLFYLFAPDNNPTGMSRIKVDLPTQVKSVRTHKACFGIILRYLFHLAVAYADCLSADSHADPNDNHSPQLDSSATSAASDASPLQPRLIIRTERSPTKKQANAGIISIVLHLELEIFAKDAARARSMNKMLYLCKIISSCSPSGKTEINTDSISFSLDCNYLDESMSDLNEDQNENGLESSEHAKAKMDYTALHELKLLFLSTEATAMSIYDMFDWCQAKQVTTFNSGTDVPMQLVTDTDVAFIASLSDFKSLRDKGYSGFIVLITAEKDNIGASILSNFDYTMTIPCSDSDILLLNDWLTDSVLTNPNKGANQNKFTSEESRFNDKYNIVYQIPSDKMELFLNWRFLNPTNYWRHYTTIMSLSLVYYVCSGMNFALRFGPTFHKRSDVILYRAYPVIIFLFFLAFVFRKTVYFCLLKPSGLSLHTTVSILSLFLLNLYINDIRYYSTEDIMIRIMYGLDLFSCPLIAHEYPVVFLLPLVQFYFASQKFFEVSPMFPAFITVIIYAVIVFAFALKFIVQFHFINTLRREFMGLQKLTKSKIFLENFLGLLCHDSQEILLSLQHQLRLWGLDWIDEILSGEAEFDKEFFVEQEHLPYCKLLITELINELRYFNAADMDKCGASTKHNRSSSPAITQESKGAGTPGYGPSSDILKPTLLKVHIESIISRMAAPAQAIGVNIFLKVSPLLTYVRLQKQLFTTVIINALAAALNNIRRGVEESRTVNEIVLLIEPLDVEKVQRFTDTRYMQVRIFDTREPSSKAHQSFGEKIVMRMLSEATSKNEEGHLNQPLDHKRYRSYRKFCIPYKLCTNYSISVMDDGLRGKGKSEKTSKPNHYVLVDSSSDESLYNRIAMIRGTPPSKQHKKKMKNVDRSLGIICSRSKTFDFKVLDALRAKGWQYKLLHNIEILENSYDAVLIDESSSNHVQECAMRYRSKGYRKLIAVLTRSSRDHDRDGGSDSDSGLGQWFPVAAEAEDSVVKIAVSSMASPEQFVKDLTRLCDKAILSELLHLNE